MTGIGVIHVQNFIHKSAIILVAVELRVGFDLAQPSDIREFEGAAASKVTVIFLHARSNDLSHAPGVELVLFIRAMVVGAGLQSIAR